MRMMDDGARARDTLAELNGLSESLCRGGPTAELFDLALGALQRTVGADRASILLTDRSGVMRFTAWRGLSDEYRKMVDGHSPWPPDAQDPAPLLIEDVRADPSLGNYGPIFEAERIRALGFIPLVAGGRLIGKFMVYYAQPHPFRPEEIALARTIANFVASAVALDRARRRSEEAAARTARLQELTA
ncbi:MAG: GAF domain-containing protein, partial [Myxococcales bacterium]